MRGLATAYEVGTDASKDDPRREGGPHEDLGGDAKGVWHLLEVQPRTY